MASLPVTAYLAIGSNLGDRALTCWQAVAKLAEHPQIQLQKISTLFETAAVGGPPDSPAFLNGAIQIQTTLGAYALLEAMVAVEHGLGRERREKWAPRTIDLDILLFGDKVISSEKLVIPHPLMHQRRFVLEPLAQIAPELVHPMLQMTIKGLLQSVL